METKDLYKFHYTICHCYRLIHYFQLYFAFAQKKKAILQLPKSELGHPSTCHLHQSSCTLASLSPFPRLAIHLHSAWLTCLREVSMTGPFLVDLISMRALNMENHHSSVIDSSGEGENVAAVMMRVKLLLIPRSLWTETTVVSTSWKKKYQRWEGK